MNAALFNGDIFATKNNIFSLALENICYANTLCLTVSLALLIFYLSIYFTICSGWLYLENIDKYILGMAECYTDGKETVGLLHGY